MMTAPDPAPVAPAAPEPVVPTPAADSGPAVAAAATPTPVLYQAVATGNEMRLEGDSTAHKWVCVSKIIAGFLEVEPAWLTDLTLQSVASLGPGRSPPRCMVRIPVRSLKSQVSVGASIMDSRLQTELNARQFPMIEYRLTGMAIKGKVPASGTPVLFDTTGLLIVRGATNKVSFPVRMERLASDGLRFTGVLETRMAALGVKPPEFKVLGLEMKTMDLIRLTWTWTLAPQPPAAESR